MKSYLFLFTICIVFSELVDKTTKATSVDLIQSENIVYLQKVDIKEEKTEILVVKYSDTAIITLRPGLYQLNDAVTKNKVDSLSLIIKFKPINTEHEISLSYFWLELYQNTGDTMAFFESYPSRWKRMSTVYDEDLGNSQITIEKMTRGFSNLDYIIMPVYLKGKFIIKE